MIFKQMNDWFNVFRKEPATLQNKNKRIWRMETGNKLAIATVHDRSVGKESACNVRDQGWIPGSGRSPREGNGNPLQYSRLENTMDSGAWEPTVHGVAKSRTRLSD